MSDAIIIGLFSAIGGLYVLFMTGLYLVLNKFSDGQERMGHIEDRLGHHDQCQGKTKKALRLLLRRVREIKKVQGDQQLNKQEEAAQ